MCLVCGNNEKELYAIFQQKVANRGTIRELINITEFNQEKIESFTESFYQLKMFESQGKGLKASLKISGMEDPGIIIRSTFVNHLCVISSKSVRDLANRIFIAICTEQERMSFRDYVRYYDIVQSKDPEKKLGFNYRLIDQCNKGYFTKEDFKEFIVQFFSISETTTEKNSMEKDKRRKWIDQLVDKFFDVFDINKDGHINQEEFIKMAKINPTMSDILFNLAGGVTDIVNNEEHDKIHNCLSEVQVAKKEVETIKNRVERLQDFANPDPNNTNFNTPYAHHIKTQFPTNFTQQRPESGDNLNYNHLGENIDQVHDNEIRKVTANFSTNLKAGNLFWVLDMERNLENQIGKRKSMMPSNENDKYYSHMGNQNTTLNDFNSKNQKATTQFFPTNTHSDTGGLKPISYNSGKSSNQIRDPFKMNDNLPSIKMNENNLYNTKGENLSDRSSQNLTNNTVRIHTGKETKINSVNNVNMDESGLRKQEDPNKESLGKEDSYLQPRLTWQEKINPIRQDEEERSGKNFIVVESEFHNASNLDNSLNKKGVNNLIPMKQANKIPEQKVFVDDDYDIKSLDHDSKISYNEHNTINTHKIEKNIDINNISNSSILPMLKKKQKEILEKMDGTINHMDKILEDYDFNYDKNEEDIPDNLSNHFSYFPNKKSAFDQNKKQMKYVKLFNLDDKKVKHEDQALKDKQIDINNCNYSIVVFITIGIFRGITSLHNVKQYIITNFDYVSKNYFELKPVYGSDASMNFNKCKFYDYFPYIFNDLRKRFGINNTDFCSSVGPERFLNGQLNGNLNTLSELTSSGKSGSFFYYTPDGKYMLKTIPYKEFLVMCNTIKGYHQHVINDPQTLITSYVGLFAQHLIRNSGQRMKIYFVMMKNVFRCDYPLEKSFDLKGSYAARTTDAIKNPNSIRKDNNWREENERIYLTLEEYETVVAKVKNDSLFLRNNNILDYSLLVGIHKVPDIGPEEGKMKSVFNRKSYMTCKRGDDIKPK